MTEANRLDDAPPSVLVPVPDPTTLTNRLVAQAVSALREIIETRLAGIELQIRTLEATQVRHSDIAIANLEQLLQSRISANGSAIDVLRTASEKRLETMEGILCANTRERNGVIEALRVLMSEKIGALCETVAVFKTSVNERFQLGDVQTEKAARDVKSAVDAAFAAAKEAVGEQNKSNALSIAKSEVATTKQIDQLALNAITSAKNADDKISDLKDRLVAMEGRSSGSSHGQTALIGWFIAALMALGLAASLVFDAIRH